MKALETLIPANLAEAIGATFMHAIWQLAAVALLLLLVYQLVPRKASRLRYNLGIAALGLMFVLPIGTFGLYYQTGSPALATAASQTDALLASGQFEQLDAVLSAETGAAFLPGISEFFSQNATLLLVIWMLGAMIFTFRLLGSYLYVQRLRRRDTHAVPESVMKALLQLKEKLGINRAVQLLQSGAVDTPMVIGMLRPVILLPIGLLSGLSSEQVQCILAHELAHIRRWDFLVNIFQSIVEICLFFHPALWWVSKMVREERENCCDETVLALKNNNMVYAKALLNLEVLRSRQPDLAMASNGGSLFKRIKRITGAETRETRIYSRSLFVGLLTLTFILLLSTTGKDDIKASTPLFNLSAPELAWEEQLPMPEAKSPYQLVSENVTTAVDTPVSKIILLENGEEIVIAMDRNGKVESVDVDGRAVPKSEFSRYKKMATGTMHNYLNANAAPMPTPPSPPNMRKLPPAPTPPQMNGNNMPAPPAPPEMGEMPVPPAPPARRNLNDAEYERAMDKYGAKMERWGEKLEKSLKNVDWGKFENDMEAWGAKLEQQFEGKDWKRFEREMEEWGENFAASFDDGNWEEFGEAMGEWGEEFGAKMEEWGAELGAEMERAVEQRTVQMEERERQVERQRDHAERQRDHAEHQRDRAEHYRSGVDDIQDALEDDGFLRNANSYKLRINGEELYINGNRKSDSMHRKYTRLIERALDIDIDDEWVEINQKKKSRKTKIRN